MYREGQDEFMTWSIKYENLVHELDYVCWNFHVQNKNEKKKENKKLWKMQNFFWELSDTKSLNFGIYLQGQKLGV